MNREAGSIEKQLKKLARLYNVQTSYYDLNHKRSVFAGESLLGALKALGAPVNKIDDVTQALRERRQGLCRRITETVTVAWDGAKPEIKICLPEVTEGTTLDCRLETEAGEVSEWETGLERLTAVSAADAEGIRYITRQITLPKPLPWGYHRFTVETKGHTGETLIISAPKRTYVPAGEESRREWGAFIPLYALRTKTGWGSGDYTALGKLGEGIAGMGGGMTATLPLLPAFLDEPYDPSPYAPVSRLLWNEFYIDVNAIPELKDCGKVKQLIQSTDFQNEVRRQQESRTTDYQKIMSLKRRALTELSRYIYNSHSEYLTEQKKFARDNPIVEKYAQFRAVTDKRHRMWQEWPQSLRGGEIKENDYDIEDMKYHLYAQWTAHRQVEKLAGNSRRNRVKLYFDLPLGVHAGGFDAWQYREIFARGATTGAPPDPVFTGGQDWGCPPLHPEKIREQGYRYVIDYLRHHLRYADMLRIDHVMGMHRLFWIPHQGEAGRGVYVRYHADEMYAILAVESHRSRSVIVGEDLGIVPSYVRKAMAGHGLRRMYILYYEIIEKGAGTPKKIAPNTVAALNTHDMAPFASFWEEKDIDERKGLGLAGDKDLPKERKSRRAVKAALTTYLKDKKYLGNNNPGTREMLEACFAYLGASRAKDVLINLEDLWLETEAQNVPGVGDKYPSWKNKARYTLEEMLQSEEVIKALKEATKIRKTGNGKEG